MINVSHFTFDIQGGVFQREGQPRHDFNQVTTDTGDGFFNLLSLFGIFQFVTEGFHALVLSDFQELSIYPAIIDPDHGIHTEAVEC